MSMDELIRKSDVIKSLIQYSEGKKTIGQCIDECEVVKPQTGHWEWLTEDKYRCSNCNHETRVDECMNEPMYDFCPFCGCRMEG